MNGEGWQQLQPGIGFVNTKLAPLPFEFRLVCCLVKAWWVSGLPKQVIIWAYNWGWHHPLVSSNMARWWPFRTLRLWVEPSGNAVGGCFLFFFQGLYAYVYIYKQTCIYIYINKHVHIYTYICCIHSHMCTHFYLSIYLLIYLSTYLPTYLPICLSIYLPFFLAHMCVCVLPLGWSRIKWPEAVSCLPARSVSYDSDGTRVRVNMYCTAKIMLLYIQWFFGDLGTIYLEFPRWLENQSFEALQCQLKPYGLLNPCWSIPEATLTLQSWHLSMFFAFLW